MITRLFLVLLVLFTTPAYAGTTQPSSGGGSGSPTGAAGGDLSGTYPNPTVAKINGQTIGSAAYQNTTAFDASGTAAAAQAASLQKTNNLSDLNSVATARTNLGLGSAATQNTNAFDAAGAAAAAQQPGYPIPTAVAVAMPSGFAAAWDTTHFPVTVSLIDNGSFAPGPSSGSVTIDGASTPEALFNLYSTALSSPGTTLYVNVSTGSDSNSCTSSGSACATMYHAQALANTAGLPAKIIVAGPAVCIRSCSPSYTGQSATVDTAYVATGGRVVVGTFDAYTAMAAATGLNAAYTTSYYLALVNVEKVVDLLNKNQWGNYIELQNVGSDALANATPGSWTTSDGTNIVVHRADGQAVTNANTRIYRSGAYGGFRITHPVNIYVGDGGITNFPNNGFDCEGSDGTDVSGCFTYYIASPTNTTLNAVVISHSTFKYASGIVMTSGHGIGIDGLYGLSAFFDDTAGASNGDAFSFHNNTGSGTGSTEQDNVLVNCLGRDVGRYTNPPNTSINGLTAHDNTNVIDVGGEYAFTHGRTVGMDGTGTAATSGKIWLVGTYAHDDLGDTIYGGAINPELFAALQGETMWLDRVSAGSPAGGVAIAAENTTATIYLHGIKPYKGVQVGTGTFVNY